MHLGTHPPFRLLRLRLQPALALALVVVVVLVVLVVVVLVVVSLSTGKVNEGCAEGVPNMLMVVHKEVPPRCGTVRPRLKASMACGLAFGRSTMARCPGP